jgi:uncharacterized protein
MIIISPAKRMLPKSQFACHQTTVPYFLNEAATLINHLKRLSISDIESLMDVSYKIADLNFQRYKLWQKKLSQTQCNPATLIFDGAVYRGLAPKNMLDKNSNFMNENLRILSGLYGLLKPFDLIYHYRLEMGTKLKTVLGKNLYSFWGNKITEKLNQEIDKSSQKFLVNLASNEYFKSINSEVFQYPIYTPIFKNYSKGQFKTVSIYAKKARGLMAAYIIKNKITNINEIKNFKENNYKFSASSSTVNKFVFLAQ